MRVSGGPALRRHPSSDGFLLVPPLPSPRRPDRRPPAACRDLLQLRPVRSTSVAPAKLSTLAMSSISSKRALDLERILDEPVDWRYKSFPTGDAVRVRAVGEQRWNVLDGDFMPPVMVLKDSALRHNLDEMASYCRGNGISLAPHVKTHMAPQLFQMQLDAGAWALTVANISQARVWRAFGADRVILANELVEPTSVRWIAEELKHDRSFEFYCLVDSVACVARLDSALEDSGLPQRLDVLLEVGFAGGRTGCRTPEDARDVAAAVTGSRHLALAGVESFEG